ATGVAPDHRAELPAGAAGSRAAGISQPVGAAAERSLVAHADAACLTGRALRRWLVRTPPGAASDAMAHARGRHRTDRQRGARARHQLPAHGRTAPAHGRPLRLHRHSRTAWPEGAHLSRLVTGWAGG